MRIDKRELAERARRELWARKQLQDRQDRDREFVQDWIARFWRARVGVEKPGDRENSAKGWF